MSAYLRIHEDGTREQVRRPRAFHDDGQKTLVSDAWLVENAGIYSVREPEAIPPLADLDPIEAWELHADHVLKTYTPLTFSRARERRRADLAAVRWRVETGGMVTPDGTVQTDPSSQGKLIAAFVAQQQGWVAPVGLNWKRGGSFARVTPGGIQAMAQLAFTFVQDCFDREEHLLTQIDAAATLDELRAIDITSGWPSNAATPGELAWASL